MLQAMVHQPRRSGGLPHSVSQIRQRSGACLVSVSGLLSARSTRRLGIPLAEIRLRPRSGVSPRSTEMHRVIFDKVCYNISLVDAIRHDLARPPLGLNVFDYDANRNSRGTPKAERGRGSSLFLRPQASGTAIG